jgi:hypothetical protein
MSRFLLDRVEAFGELCDDLLGDRLPSASTIGAFLTLKELSLLSGRGFFESSFMSFLKALPLLNTPPFNNPGF